MKKIIACLLCTILLVTLNATAQFKEATKGMQYLIVSNGEGKAVANGNFMEVHVKQVYETGGTDSVLYNSREHASQIFQFDSSAIPPMFYKIFAGVKIGDSIILKQLTDSILADENSLPPFIQKGNFITGYYKIVNIYETKEAAEVAYNEQKRIAISKDSAETALQFGKDNAVIEKYLSEKNIKAIQAPLGTYVQIIKQGTGPIAATGKMVKIFYTGRTIPGEKIFDSNTDSAFNHTEPFSFKMTGAGEQPSVIIGFEDGISLLKKGAVAKLFIPSVLAYGKGGGGEFIGPNQNLCFDIKVADVFTELLDKAPAPSPKKKSVKLPAKKKKKKK